MRIHQKSVEEHSAVPPKLRKLQPQVPFVEFPGTPSLKEALELVAVKAPPRLIQEFEVGGHGDYILVVLPLLPNLEVTEDFARYIGFQGPFH